MNCLKPPPPTTDIEAENRALHARLAKAQATINAMAVTLGRENFASEQAALYALEEWTRERKRPLGEGDGR
jgi:hypothetical protein